MKISIIGNGVYGMSLAKSIKPSCEVFVWTEQNINEVQNKLHITNDLELVVKDANLLIICVASPYFIQTIINLKKYYHDCPILIGTKGISDTDEYFYTDIVKRLLNTKKCGYFAGPTFAFDFQDLTPIGLSVATTKDVFSLFQQVLLKHIHLELIDNEKGLALCSVAKNIMAIGCGYLKGLKINESTTTFFLMKMIQELRIIFNHFALDSSVLYCFGGFGDLYLTTKDHNSRNYIYGYKLALKEDMNDFEKKNTIEGKEMLKIIINIIKKEDISLPYFTILYEIIVEKKPLSLLEELNN